MGEHLACFLSGQYTTYHAPALSRGEYRRANEAVVGCSPDTLPSFLENADTLLPNVVAMIRLINIRIAPLSGDAHLHNRVEGAIGRYFKVHPDAELRDFFFPGMRVPEAIPFDKSIRIALSSEAPIAGLPLEICE